jgi:hypothetical protein
MGFVVDKVELGKVAVHPLQFSSVSIMPTFPCTHISFTCHQLDTQINLENGIIIVTIKNKAEVLGLSCPHPSLLHPLKCLILLAEGSLPHVVIVSL